MSTFVEGGLVYWRRPYAERAPAFLCGGDRASISIHVYGGHIGAVTRSVYLAGRGRKTFISGYSNDVLPSIWNVSRESLIS
ncbi:hypothetical protein P3T22_004316 [Paraburkholderia sp. GAS348]